MAGEGESGNHDGDRSQPNGDSSPPSDHGNVNGNPTPSTPDSPTSTGFNTDQLPLNTSQNFSEDDDDGEASVDPYIVRDEPEIEEEEEEGEDLFNDNYMDDYRRMDEQDHYESLDLDDSMEDERDLDQIMADRRAAEVELDTRDTRVASSQRKLPQLLHDQGPPFTNVRIYLFFFLHRYLFLVVSVLFLTCLQNYMLILGTSTGF